MSPDAPLETEGDTLRLRGGLDLTTVAGLWSDSRALFESPRPPARVDVSVVDRVDSAGVALLVQWVAMAQARGVTLRVEGMNPAMGDLIALADLEPLLPVPGDEAGSHPQNP